MRVKVFNKLARIQQTGQIHGLCAALAVGLVVTSAMTLAGCHEMVRVDPNDPLFQARAFAIEPLNFSTLMVGDKPEAVYLAGKNHDQQMSFEADKAESALLFGTHFADQLARAGITVSAPSAAVPFTIRVNVEYFEPGNFNGFVNFSSELRMTLQILNAQGQPVGMTPLAARVPATFGNPSSGGRFRQAAETLGNAAGQYILRRTGLGY